MSVSSEQEFHKSPLVSLKWSHYFAIYDRLFANYVGKEITFVEIGVGEGGSLFLWRALFGASARIIGIDLNPEAKKLESHGFEIVIGNQSDPAFWNDFFNEKGKVDIVLEDGGHTYVQQIQTSISVLDWLKPGGLLVVEDTHTSRFSGFGFRGHSFTRWAAKLAERLSSEIMSPSGRLGLISKIESVEFYSSIVAFRASSALLAEAPVQVVNKGYSNGNRDVRALDNFSRSGMNLVGTYLPTPRLAKLFKKI